MRNSIFPGLPGGPDFPFHPSWIDYEYDAAFRAEFTVIDGDGRSGDSKDRPTLKLIEGGRASTEVPPAVEEALPQLWPELMSAELATRYLGERNVRSFRRKVGRVYPRPATHIPGRGDVWLKVDLDDYLAALRGQSVVRDAADLIEV